MESGSSEIRVYVQDVDRVEVERLMELFADVLVERGYARNGEARALLTAEPWEWPEDGDAFVAKVIAGDVSCILIPCEDEDELDLQND